MMSSLLSLKLTHKLRELHELLWDGRDHKTGTRPTREGATKFEDSHLNIKNSLAIYWAIQGLPFSLWLLLMLNVNEKEKQMKLKINKPVLILLFVVFVAMAWTHRPAEHEICSKVKSDGHDGDGQFAYLWFLTQVFESLVIDFVAFWSVGSIGGIATPMADDVFAGDDPVTRIDFRRWRHLPLDEPGFVGRRFRHDSGRRLMTLTFNQKWATLSHQFRFILCGPFSNRRLTSDFHRLRGRRGCWRDDGRWWRKRSFALVGFRSEKNRQELAPLTADFLPFLRLDLPARRRRVALLAQRLVPPPQLESSFRTRRLVPVRWRHLLVGWRPGQRVGASFRAALIARIHGAIPRNSRVERHFTRRLFCYPRRRRLRPLAWQFLDAQRRFRRPTVQLVHVAVHCALLDRREFSRTAPHSRPPPFRLLYQSSRRHHLMRFFVDERKRPDFRLLFWPVAIRTGLFLQGTDATSQRLDAMRLRRDGSVVVDSSSSAEIVLVAVLEHLTLLFLSLPLLLSASDQDLGRVALINIRLLLVGPVLQQRAVLVRKPRSAVDDIVVDGNSVAVIVVHIHRHSVG